MQDAHEENLRQRVGPRMPGEPMLRSNESYTDARNLALPLEQATNLLDAATVQAAASVETWMESLRPPLGTRPSVGEWPSGMQWLEMGRQMVETQGLEMLRTVGEFSACLMLGRHLGAPLGVDARVDAAWAAFHEICNHPDWGPACIAHVLDDMADVDARRRAEAERELRELFEPRNGLVRLRRLATEFWPTTSDRPDFWPTDSGPPYRRPPQHHPADTYVCWAWCVAAESHSPRARAHPTSRPGAGTRG